MASPHSSPTPIPAHGLDGESPSNVRYRVLFVTTLASIMLYLDRVCISEVLKYSDAREALSLTDSQVAWIMSAFFWSYALLQVPCGWLSDRHGARLALALYVASWSAFTALTGFASGFAMLFALRLGVGVAQAGAYPTSGALLSRWMPLDMRAFGSSVVACGGRLGGAVAPFLTAWLILLCGNWRPVMLLYGGLGIAVAALFWTVFRDRPGEHPRSNPAERRLIDRGRPQAWVQASARRDHGRESRLVIARLVRSGSMWLMCLSQFTTNIGWVFLITLLPTYLRSAKQVPDRTGATMATLVLLVGMCGMLLGGRATDWTTRRWGLRWGRVLPLVVSRFAAAGAFLCLPWLESAWAAVAAFALVALATDFGVAGTWAYMQDVGGRYVASILGWGNMWGNFGAAVSPPLLDWIGETAAGLRNWDAGFLVCALSFAISGLASLGIDATTPIAPLQPVPE